MVQKILNDQSIWLGRKGAGWGGELVDCLILGEWLQDGGGNMDFDLQKFLDIGEGRKGGGMGTDFDLHFVDVRGVCVWGGGMHGPYWAAVGRDVDLMWQMAPR